MNKITTQVFEASGKDDIIPNLFRSNAALKTVFLQQELFNHLAW